ncbi:MAG: winged helix-turn-helix domain-containing protein [Candidatus Caldarchaeum sp.]
MKDYRSRARIYSDILESISSQGFAKPTRIMLDANLSYDRLTKYLSLLMEKGLVKKHEGSELSYVITEKGLHYLSEFKKFEKLAAAFGLRL